MELTTDQKITAVIHSKEVEDAVKLLIAVMDDCNLKNYIRINFQANDKKYELLFTPILNEMQFPKPSENQIITL